jgi:hypothetical protein
MMSWDFYGGDIMIRRSTIAIAVALLTAYSSGWATELPRNLQIVLDSTKPLAIDRGERLPLFVLPISNSLSRIDEAATLETLKQLDRRGIGYSVDWNHNDFDNSLAEGLRIARMQISIGQRVAVNANACLHSFFDGSEATLHIDNSGNTFAETSFGGKLGCPFALGDRVPIIKARIEKFLRSYKDAGIEIDFVFADWEIDGPIEWNDAWQTCKKCVRCRENIARIDDFRVFQSELRRIRSQIQRVAFGDNVTSYFPEALVGNYAVYPHNGYRYWYDYFEKEPTGVPLQTDQRANYREWVHEFDGTGYTFAMPVVYTWYPTFQWYDFDNHDYRWFYNMLKVGSNAGQHTEAGTPIIPFVHWTTTSPPEAPDPNVKQFSKEKYQALLWHLLLRGHDTFFLWCTADELADEVRLVHQVYAESLHYAGFLSRGTPITFDVPNEADSVVSGMRLGNRVLVRRTNFSDDQQPTLFNIGTNDQITVPKVDGLQVVSVNPAVQEAPGLLRSGDRVRFPIGFYEHPKDNTAFQEMAVAGVNLVRCSNRSELDRAGENDMMGWVSLPVQAGATSGLREQIEAVADHPALAVWEGPDEIVWTFTAYSFLKQKAGFSREDWNNQTDVALEYANRVGGEVTKKMNEGVSLVREMDKRNLPFWVNEAADSDVKFVRQYIDSIDITGCDYYAVRSEGSDLQSVGRLVDRWDAIGRGRPVWMVLQGFSWHVAKSTRTLLYPTFVESRFMAYDSIVHGAKGILYWGTNEIDDPEFRESLYGLTSELSEIEPLLVGKDVPGVKANLIDDLFDTPGLGVRAKLFEMNNDVLLILVNEDGHRHLGVDVTGLGQIEGRELSLLYGVETCRIEHGGLVTRMQPYEVKLFATHPRFETKRTAGRTFGSYRAPGTTVIEIKPKRR